MNKNIEYYLSKTKDGILSQTARHTGVILIGNTISSIVGILFALVAAYYLSTENWGIVASVRNLINILIAVADLGLGAALFQYSSSLWKESPNNARSAFKDIFSIRILTGILFCIILIVFAELISKIAFGFVDKSIIYLSTIGFIGVLFLDFQVFAVQSRHNWVGASVLIAATNIFRIITLLVLVYYNQVTLTNVLFGYSISGVLAFLVGIFYLPHFPSFKFNILKILSQFGAFSFWMSSNKIVSTVGARIDVLLVLQILGAHQAGIYGLASTFAVGVPLIIGSFATILAAKFASIKEKNALQNYFYKSIGLSLFISFFLIIGILFVPYVISLFGQKYAEARSVLQWLFVAMIPFAMATPAVNILIYHFKRPNIIASLSIVQLVVILGINYYCLPKIGIYAPVWAQGVSNLITMTVTYFYALKYLARLK